MTIPPQQQDVAAVLSRLSGAAPTETHISAVFVGADTVWKLKKAVRMPFLDFRDRAARAHFLRRELALNKPAAPGIYRDVVPILRHATGELELGPADSAFELGPAGDEHTPDPADLPSAPDGDDPIDWVLRMAPVPARDFLDVIAATAELTPQRLDELGDAIATYHASLDPVANVDSAAAMRRITQGNAASALAADLPRDTVETWQRDINTIIDADRDWLAERSASGFVRRCHGDLHLGNICLWQGKPVPFDALEFDEDLATIDTGYDLAFLLMDLDRKVGRPAANRVMNRYLMRLGDAPRSNLPLRGLPLFLSQRAMIRAHVLKAMNQDASAYLAQAQSYLRPPPPVMLAIGGLQGTGKSTLARTLAPELGAAPGALILRSDELRKRLHHADPESRLGADAYSAAANAETNAAVLRQAGFAAATGHAVIVDATFLDLAMRHDLANAAQRAGIPFVGVWLYAPLSVLEARIAARRDDASDATVAVLHKAAANEPGAADWLAVDASDQTQALAAIRRAVESTRQPPSA